MTDNHPIYGYREHHPETHELLKQCTMTNKTVCKNVAFSETGECLMGSDCTCKKNEASLKDEPENNQEQIPAGELKRMKEKAASYDRINYGWSKKNHSELTTAAYIAGAKDEYLRAHSSQPTGQLLSELKGYRAFLRTIGTAANIGVIRHEARQLIERYPELPLQPIKEPVVEMEKKKELGPEHTKSLHRTVCGIIERHIRLGHARDQQTEEDYPIIEGRSELADEITHTWAGMLDAVYEVAATWEEKYNDLLTSIQQEAIIPASVYVTWLKAFRESLKAKSDAAFKESQSGVSFSRNLVGFADGLTWALRQVDGLLEKEPQPGQQEAIPEGWIEKATIAASMAYPESGMHKDGDRKSRAHQRAFVDGVKWLLKEFPIPDQLSIQDILNHNPDKTFPPSEHEQKYGESLQPSNEADIAYVLRSRIKALQSELSALREEKETCDKFNGSLIDQLKCELRSAHEEKEEYRKALIDIRDNGGGRLSREDRSRMAKIAYDILDKYPSSCAPTPPKHNEIELKSTVELPGGETSRTLEELYKAVPQPWRDRILRCTGVGTALQPLLEYVARFAESRMNTRL